MSHVVNPQYRSSTHIPVVGAPGGATTGYYCLQRGHPRPKFETNACVGDERESVKWHGRSAGGEKVAVSWRSKLLSANKTHRSVISRPFGEIHQPQVGKREPDTTKPCALARFLLAYPISSVRYDVGRRCLPFSSSAYTPQARAADFIIWFEIMTIEAM